MAQSTVKCGSVVLIRYPFTDLSGEKRRPAVVLARSHRGDVIVASIGTHIGKRSLYEVLLKKDDEDFEKTGLHETSVVDVDRIMTLDLRVASGELGFMPARYYQRVVRKLSELMEY